MTEQKTVRRKNVRRPQPRRRVLRIVYSPDASASGRAIVLSREAVTFGRTATDDGQVDDVTMSRTHFRIVPEVGAQYLVEDLGTANGTFVDGERLTKSKTLNPDQVIAAGESLFVVDVEPGRHKLPVANDATPGEVDGLVGISLAADRLRRALRTVAEAPGAVLLLGATGSGKEVAARAIHEQSGRSGELVAVNCAAIPKDMAEAELFGFVRGAFTGAEAPRIGHIEQAHEGTLFLDEIGDLPETLQAKLLRVLENGEVQRIGAERPTKVDVRFVGATHKDLEGVSFRKDLYARLSDWVLRLPALAERRADILPLFEHFLGCDSSAYTAEVAEALLLHDWPMNVRELEKLARRLRTLASGDTIVLDDLPELLTERMEHRRTDDDEDFDPDDPSIAAPPRDELVAALVESKGNVKEAAISNGWHRNQLYRWLKRRNIRADAFRK